MQYAGVMRSDGGYRDPKTCEEFATFLEKGRYTYVAVNPRNNKFTDWIAAQPNSRHVTTQPLGLGFEGVVVYRLDPAVRHRTC